MNAIPRSCKGSILASAGVNQSWSHPIGAFRRDRVRCEASSRRTGRHGHARWLVELRRLRRIASVASGHTGSSVASCRSDKRQERGRKRRADHAPLLLDLTHFGASDSTSRRSSDNKRPSTCALEQPKSRSRSRKTAWADIDQRTERSTCESLGLVPTSDSRSTPTKVHSSSRPSHARQTMTQSSSRWSFVPFVRPESDRCRIDARR